MPVAHEQISVLIDGRSIVEAYTKRRLLHDLTIRHRQDGTAEVHNRELFNHMLAIRKGLLLATQQASQAITKALTSPDPKTTAAGELKRLADVAKARDPKSYTDPNSLTEMFLRPMISETETSDLDALAKAHQAKLAVIAPHTQLKEVKQP